MYMNSSYNDPYSDGANYYKGPARIECPIPAKRREQTNFTAFIVLSVTILVSASFAIFIWNASNYNLTKVWHDDPSIDHNVYEDVFAKLDKAFETVGFGLALILIVLLLFRFFPALIVWTILIGSFAALVALCVTLWVLQATYPAILFTIFAVILLLIGIFFMKRIQLLILLMKETTKVIFNIPIILIQPIPTVFAYIIMYTFIIVLFLSYGSSTNISDGVGGTTVVLSLILGVWLSFFFIGCQNMIIAGTVSTHYFTADKSSLSIFGAIVQSYYTMIRYHLGTVALTSGLLMLFYYFKRILRPLARRNCCCCLCMLCITCWANSLEEFLQFLSKYIYIITAMHGLPFFDSGKKALQLLLDHCMSSVAVNFVGAYIMFMCNVLIVAGSFGFGMLAFGSSSEAIAANVCGCIIVLILSAMVFNVFEVTMDTLLMCFCEDLNLNNGMDRPYFMSKGLLKYVRATKTE